MPDTLLTILKFCFLALLYLFFIRVLRAVWAEVYSSRPVVAAPASARPSGRDRAEAALADGLSVILCIGESLDVREAGKAVERVEAQLDASLQVKAAVHHPL